MNVTDILALLDSLGCTNAHERTNGWVESTCPFAAWTHKKGIDRSPSFGVSISASDMSFYRCHACNERGTVRWLPRALQKYRQVPTSVIGAAASEQANLSRVSQGFVKLAEQVSEPTYIEVAGVYVDRRLLPKTFELKPAFDESVLTPFRDIPPNVRAWLQGPKRKLDDATIAAWDIGFDKKRGRVSIPIRDMEGVLRGYSGRAFFDQKPKFMHSAGFQRDIVLFGEQTATKGHTGYIVEGFFDVMQLQRWGYPAVAVLGTSVSNVHVEKLARFFKDVVIVLDGDKAGEDGAVAIRKKIAERMPLRTVHLPTGLDPVELHDPVQRASFLGEPLPIAA